VLEPLAMRDLGSSNGTVVRGGRVSPGVLVPLAVGEAVHLGDVAVLVHRLGRGEPLRRKPEGRFEHLVAAACARAARTGTPFAVARLHAAAPGRAPESIGDAVASCLGAADVLVEAAPGQCQLILADADGGRAAGVVERLRQRLGDDGLSTLAGVAAWPRDGVTAEQLAARAWQLLLHPPTAPVEMDRVRALATQVADSQLCVLVHGETGVGKELCAEMIHRLSARATRPFLKLNCAALSDALLESELFGHERGAFTGATATKPGLLEIADGGTVFLDEIGELPLPLQAKLLHVLEDRLVKRVGGLEARAVDVRFVAATNRALEQELAHGRFRQDLYFRLSGVTIDLPPLRARRDEIEGLARAFAAFASDAARRALPVFADDAVLALLGHPWPGNVRELRHTIERSVLLCGDGPLRAAHLRIGAAQPPAAPTWSSNLGRLPAHEITPSGDLPAVRSSGSSLHDEVAGLERDRIREALDACGGNQTHAARMLGIARGTLRARMREYGLTPRR